MAEKHKGEAGTPERKDLSNADSGQISNDTDETQANKEASLVRRGGCLKGCLLPILFTVVVVSILALGLYNRRDALHRWIFKRIISNTQSQVLRDLPKGLDRNYVEEVFKNVKEAFDEGKLDEEMVKERIDSYLNTIESIQTLEQRKAEIEKLLIGLKASIVSKPPRSE